MAKMVNEGVRLPDDIDHIADGKTLVKEIPANLTAPVGPGGKWRMHHKVAPLLDAAYAAVKAELGVDLSIIPGGGSTIRSLAQQEKLFLSRYVPGGNDKTWKGQGYRLRPGMAMAASPGTSGHGFGTAVDLCFGNGKAVDAGTRNRIRPVMERFGFKDTVKSENWHWNQVDADKFYAQHFGGGQPAPAAPPAAAPGAGLAPDVMTGNPGIYPLLPVEAFAGLPTLNVGSDGPEVTYVRLSLVLVGNQADTPLVGAYDDDLKRRVSAFQEGWKVLADPAMNVDGTVEEQDYVAFGTAWAFSGKLPK